MKNKKSFITLGMSTLLIMLTVFLCITMFNTVNKVFFDATVNQTLETLEVVRGLGIHLVDNKLRELKDDLEEKAVVLTQSYESSNDVAIEDIAPSLTNLPLPQDGIDYLLADANGVVIDEFLNSYDISSEVNLTDVFSQQKTVIIDPYFNQDGEYTMAVVTPLQLSQQSYLLILRLDGYCVSRWMEDIQFEIGSGLSYIINAEGRNIATSKEETYEWITSQYNSQELATQDEESKTVAQLEKQVLDGHTGRGSYLWKGEENYLVYAPIEETNWGFFVGFYGEDMNNFIKDSAIGSISSSVPFFIALTGLFFLFVFYINYNFHKERNYVNELLRRNQEIEKQAEELKINEERFRVAMAQSNNIIFEYDLATGRITNYYAHQVKHIVNSFQDLKDKIITNGVIADESAIALQTMFDDIRDGVSNYECVITVLFPDQTNAWYKVSVSPKSKQQSRIIGIMEDITKEKLGELDPLTGLLNTIVFKQKVIHHLVNDTTLSALLIFDIDNFKKINDTYGHPFGDKVIIQAGQNLKHRFSQHAMIGRLGGDEFCVFCYGLTSTNDLNEILEQLFQNPDQMENDITITYSCGIVFHNHNQKYDELYQQADMALYEAKKRGKNGFYIYNENMKKDK